MSKRNEGFSLIEILIVMLIFMVIIAGVLDLFIGMLQIRDRTDKLIVMQENARFAISTITNKIQTAGYEMPVDGAIFPDPKCSEIGSYQPYCYPERVADTDGIIVFTSVQERKMFRPFYQSGYDITCNDSSVLVPNTGGPISGNTLEICTPSGMADGELANQKIMVCGPVSDSNTQGCDWIIPARMPTLFNSECQVASPPSYLCCAIRDVANGPNCSQNCTGRNPTTGMCEGPTDCHEVITTTGPVFPSFLSNTPARCLFIPPAQAIHYQIHEINSRRYLMVRINNSDQWQPVASDIVDMQICYFLDSNCDPAQQCRRWQWQDPIQFQCADTLQPASIRNIRKVMIQITARTPYAVEKSLEFVENPPCIPGANPPPPPSAEGSKVWRQYTLCNTIVARNLAYIEITPPTVW